MTHTPRSHLSFRLNTLSLGLLSIISQSALAQALESFDQDNPKPNEPAQVYQGEVVEKKETLSPISGAGSSISHERNRTGNPVRVIWYDGVAQTGAINNGFIRASASGQGLANEDKTDFSGVVLADAIGNGVDAMGFVPHRRPDEVHIHLNDGITNKRLIQGSTTLTGGNALLYGNVKSWASGNGVSVASSVDYGTGADVDGYSGATNSGKSPNVESYTENRKKDDADASISDIDKPKNVSARLSKVENHSTITGSIITNGATNTRPDNDPLSSDNLSSLSAKATGSGNGISVITHAFQPKSAGRDDSKKSNNHTNIAELGSVENTGWIEGKALLSGGQYGKETYVYSEASGNGISVAALNNNNPLPDSISGHASHQTTAQISSLNNSGRILAHTQAIAKDNSPHRKIQGSNADAYTFASGNAVSVYAETSESTSHTSPVKALLGNVENTGQMQGSIELQAGNGTGYLDALTKGSGNGLIAYAHPPKPDDGKGMASIGNIHNQGIVAGSVKSKAGISSYGTVTVTEAQPLKIIVADTQNPRKLPLHLPTTPADSTLTSGMEHFRADNTVYASGNGIVGSVGLMARVNHGGNRYGASLGNIDNSGVISGYADLYHGFKSGGSRSSRGFQEITFALVGSGIALDNTFQSALQNTGIISGNHAALMAEGNTGFSRNYTDPTANAYTGTINNYGLMAGTMILGTYHYSADYRQRTESMSQPFRYYELPNPPSQFQNLGQLVRLKAGATGDNRNTTRYDDDQTIASIENGTGGVVSINGKDYTIINGDIQGTDSSHETSESALQYHIVNGVGAAKGALVATNDLDLNNSIINGLVTAVKLEGDVKFNAQDSTLNTNGFAIKGTDENKRLALLGDDGNQSALFSGNSFINGNMHFGAGDDSLTLEGGELKINGNIIDMGEGNNTITLDGNTTPLKVDYALLNANTLNLNGTVHFTAEGKFQNPTDATINIADTVIYEVNSPTEHAWFDATGNKRTYTIKGDGKMLIDADRLFGNATSDTIDFGKVDLAFGGDECTASGGATFQLSNNALLDMHIEGGDLVMGARTAVSAGGTTSSGTTCAARPTPPVATTPVTPPAKPQPKPQPKPFVTDYPDAYNSYIGAWQNGGLHFLKNTTSLNNKSLREAEMGVNVYLKQLVDDNIYASIPQFTLGNLYAQSALTLNQRPLLTKGEWSISPHVWHQRDTFKRVANQSTLNGLNLNARYGVTDNLTAGLQLSLSQERVTGHHGSKLKGRGQYIGAYVNSGNHTTLWRTGFILGQSALNANRIAYNTYDLTHTTSRLKPKVGKLYTRVEHRLSLNDTLSLVPHAELSYQWLKQSALTEQGTGSISIDPYRYQSVGADVGTALKYHNQSALAEISLDYGVRKKAHDFTARFVHGSDFKIYSEDAHQALRLGVSLGYQAQNGALFKLRAEKQRKSHQIQFGFDYSF